ncbi:MAG: hypothetical protein K9M80_02805 [Candidatus Marinimicrobia bacterium]|nr:hypothetical protein [Candidatus Neomarinimicrobiota bacterium]
MVIHRHRMFVLLIILISILSNCELFDLGSDLEDPDPPAAPNIIPQSLPDDSLQTGIGPADYVRGIYFEWYNNSEKDIGGYYIYRRTESSDQTFIKLDTVEFYTSIIEANSYIDTLVDYYKNYFYFITAYDYGNNESKPSDTIRYMLVEKVDLVTPNGKMDPPLNNFIWYEFTRLTNEYVLEMEDLENSETIWVTRFNRSNYEEEQQMKNYNFDGSSKFPKLTKNKVYRWRIHSIFMVDRSNCDLSGAKSNWNYFTIE